MKLSLIVAHDLNRVIGNEGKIPWYIPEDLKFFKQVTLGHVLIMGRKTYESLPIQPLPKRKTIIITRNKEYKVDHPDVRVVTSIEKAIMVAKLMSEKDEIFVAGGQEIYTLALPYATKAYVTVVEEHHTGDSFFPILPQESWTSSPAQMGLSLPGGKVQRFIYDRKNSSSI
jgi:dihydrofolate reductase